MMTQAFYTGISGIKSSQTGIDVTSDNIANVSTVGYRGYSTEFSSLFEEMTTTTNNTSVVDSSIGLGTRVSTTSMNQNEGSRVLTQRGTDLAINGEGWFGVQGEGEVLFTRAGDFHVDVNADLVASDGSYVLGTKGSNIKDGVLVTRTDTTPLGDVNNQEKLNFPETLTYPAEATTNVSFIANLGIMDLEDENIPKHVSGTAIDVNGDINHLQLSFTRSDLQTAPNTQWDVVATTQTKDGETIYDTQTGVIIFDELGEQVSNTLSQIDNNGTTVNIDLGKDFEGIISTDREIESSSTSDGLIGGELSGYDINQNGDIVATFSNGMQSSVGKIALYHFQNDQGLDRAGASKFSQSSNSGEAIFYKDATGQNITGSNIINYTLENSNVKMEVALTELIVLQRSFDSSSKIISTADQMLQKAISMGA